MVHACNGLASMASIRPPWNKDFVLPCRVQRMRTDIYDWPWPRMCGAVLMSDYLTPVSISILLLPP
jgi:hypothetical protein